MGTEEESHHGGIGLGMGDGRPGRSRARRGGGVLAGVERIKTQHDTIRNKS